MTPQHLSSQEDLTTGRDARILARQKERQERYLHLLRLALRARLDNGYPTDQLEAVLKQGDDELDLLTERVQGKVFPRRRPKATSSSEICTVYIDECGSHALGAKEQFKAFCLAAVILRDRNFSELDRRWKRWKRDYLGSSHRKVHEPDIRSGRQSFWCEGSTAKRKRAIEALDRVIPRLQFAGVACVLNRPRYVEEVGNRPLDESLPQHPYLMMVDFMAERLAMALHEQFNGARGRIVVESRGALEDARVQHEFARLFVDGTSYCVCDLDSPAVRPGD